MRIICSIIFSLLLTSNLWGAQRRLSCRWTATPPVIDGRLTETVWNQGELAVNFFPLNGTEKAKYQTSAVFLYDKKYLYVGVLMRKDFGEKLHTANLWNGDAVELFLAPVRTDNRYFQIAGNGKKRFTGIVVPGKEIDHTGDPKIQLAASVVPAGWLVEMAIPYSYLSVTVPQSGAEWGFNLCRDDQVHGLSTYAELHGGFHQPKLFATLVFQKPAPVASWKSAIPKASATKTAKELAALSAAVAEINPNNPAKALLVRQLTTWQARYQQAVHSELLAAIFFRLYNRWLQQDILASIHDDTAWRLQIVQLLNPTQE